MAVTDPVDEFLQKYPVTIQAICQRLREEVKSARPDGRELLYASQSHFDYSISGRMSEAVLYVVPMQGVVRLGFYWGGALPDPHGRLAGEGKRMRHIKIRSVEEAEQAGVIDLIRAAWADAEARFGSGPGQGFSSG